MKSEDFPSLSELRREYFRTGYIERRGQRFLRDDLCTAVTVRDQLYRFVVEDRFDDFTVEVDLTGDKLKTSCNCRFMNPCCSHIAAALLKLYYDFQEERVQAEETDSQIYERKEMIERVLNERRERSEKESFKLEAGETIYGIHRVMNAAGRVYEISVRDFDKEQGYCSCPDFRHNKLATCKHLMYAVRELKRKYPYRRLLEQQAYPCVEIYCDPLADYRISCYREGVELSPEIHRLLDEYFPADGYIKPENYSTFLGFLERAEEYKKILVRPEVRERIERHFEDSQLCKMAERLELDFHCLQVEPYPYQKEGIAFAVCKRGVVIADEMGLGKTLQAIATAIFKKELFSFRRVLVICPASLKFQWRQEIERFCAEEAIVVEGSRRERHHLYRQSEAYFLITNYEAVLRDVTIIKENPPDMVILDEAQRIKNYATKTSSAVKSIPRKHSLVITGTPIENRLIDLYSVMGFVDPELLAPLWEFSMEHCYFDKSKKNKITGYFNLQGLKQRLAPVIIRRLKKDVIKQLPEISELTVPIELSSEQYEMHAGFARNLTMYMGKKHKTFYDMQRIFQILTSMRMVCDSTYLIDKTTNISPKLRELEDVLLEKLDIISQKRKIIIFSEWKTMLHLIENLLKSKNIGFVRLSGDVPVKNRGRLINEFADNPDCLVFLSTEAGGAGLNLQMADTVINFELPWNPAKKNQRIGRIHRIGQQHRNLTVINLVSVRTIEERIASGIVVKEALFDAVLNQEVLTDEVDFSAKGRSTMIEQIEKMVSPFVAEAASEVELELAADGKEMPEEEDLSSAGAERAAAVEAEIGEDVLIGASSEESWETGDSAGEAAMAPAVAGESRPSSTSASEAGPAPEVMEQTLQQGIAFLGGLMEMATGRKTPLTGQSVTVDRETGEVTMKFKLPKF